MKCKVARKKITDSFAGGAAILPPDVAAHQESCAACRDFYFTQKRLFETMGAGLRAFANVLVPTSLLPRVRARLEDAHAPHVPWKLGWSSVVSAAAILLALGIAVVWHQPLRHTADAEHMPVVSRGDERTIPVSPAPKHVAGVLPRQSRRSKVVSVPHDEPLEPSLEVIVLPEERAAFARFLARLPEENDVAVALARPAPEKEDLTLEIALLHIEGMEVKPLDSTARE